MITATKKDFKFIFDLVYEFYKIHLYFIINVFMTLFIHFTFMVLPVMIASSYIDCEKPRSNLFDSFELSKKIFDNINYTLNIFSKQRTECILLHTATNFIYSSTVIFIMKIYIVGLTLNRFIHEKRIAQLSEIILFIYIARMSFIFYETDLSFSN